MGNFKKAALLLLVAGAAYGAINIERVQTLFKNVLFAGGGLVVSDTATRQVAANKVTEILPGTLTQDFLEMNDNACGDSNPITVTGAAFGDRCIGPSMDIAHTANAVMSCYVSAANTVKIRLCSNLGDAGTLNLPDASYGVTVFSHQ